MSHIANLPVALLYHISRLLSRLSICLGTGQPTFASATSSASIDPKPCPSCHSLPEEQEKTFIPGTRCRRAYIAATEYPLPLQQLLYICDALWYFTAGWVILPGNMVDDWWQPSVFMIDTSSDFSTP
ncbi:hypothetical protein DL98DRAFT_581361 [Cadophora sp. DSE1049]|nr:hypothetical protein DL98DRAFT_581361 [Cadophora sp. DSE1049]